MKIWLMTVRLRSKTPPSFRAVQMPKGMETRIMRRKENRVSMAVMGSFWAIISATGMW